MEISSQNNDAGELNVVTSEETAEKQLSNIQIMIDVMVSKLVDFRSLGLNEFALKEIRILEGKLIKHISHQMDVKQRVHPRLHLQHYPSLTDLLTVAGVSSVVANGLKNDGKSVEDLLQCNDVQLEKKNFEFGGTSEDVRKLISALSLLKKFQESRNLDTTKLYWDSWSKNPHEDVFTMSEAKNHDFNENLSNHKRCVENGTADRSRNNSESSGSLPSEPSVHSKSRATDLSLTSSGDHHRTQQLPSTSSSCLTPPSPNRGSRSSLDSDSAFNTNRYPLSSSPTPRITMFVTPTSSNTPCIHTPPVTPGTPHKSSHYLVQSTSAGNSVDSRTFSRERVSSTSVGTSRTNKLNPASLSTKLKASKSSEWHVGNRIVPPSEISASNPSLSSISTLPPPPTSKAKAQKKKKNRPDDLVLDDKNIPDFISYSRAASRRSSTTVSPESAMLRDASPLSPRTPLTPGTPYSADMWSRDRDIAPHVQVSPHMPKTPKSGFRSVKAFFAKIAKKKKLRRNKSTELVDVGGPAQPALGSSPRRRSDTMPSSRAPPNTAKLRPPDACSLCTPNFSRHPASSATQTLYPPSSASTTTSRPSSLIDTGETIIADASGSNTDTLIRDELSNETEEENTITEDTEANQTVDVLTKDNLFRQGSMMHSEEWDIPYDQLTFGDRIGCGRVGDVHRGYWHGDVAIRVIDVNKNDEQKLKAFKQEIMIYKKTRHENLELFMGSCMNPPHLAIVTGFCKGHSLYNYIRVNKAQSVNINQSKIIAQHIVQGMGYLHSKGIIHKDMKSKNIFVDGNRVVITDFGLVGLHAVSCNNRSNTPGVLVIPDGWLCYLAPEVLKSLRFPQSESDDVISTLPYTTKSDVFAFGTVWYELLAGSWPFLGSSAESLIWQVGSGKKQNLSQLQGSKDVKDILMQCWAYDPNLRPDFSDNGIMGALKKLQTQIHRSLSSHPRRTVANRSIPHDRLFDGTPLRHASPFSTMHDLAE